MIKIFIPVTDKTYNKECFVNPDLVRYYRPVYTIEVKNEKPVCTGSTIYFAPEDYLIVKDYPTELATKIRTSNNQKCELMQATLNVED